MRKILLAFLIVLLFPVYAAAFISIHEIGHVILLRLLGDPQAVFYLWKVDNQSTCLGCTSSDHEGFSWGANLAVSLGGLMATQTIALAALMLMRLGRGNLFLRRTLGVIAITFAFFDILAQVPQGLFYNLDEHTYQTSVDLMDFMLLLQMKIGASQLFLKSLLLIAACLYLIGVVWLYRRNSRGLKSSVPSLVIAQDQLQPPGTV